MSETHLQTDENPHKAIEMPPQRPRRHHRRKFSTEQKAKLVQETLRPGVNVSAVARAHNLQPNQLYHWRRVLPATLRSGGKTEPMKAADLKSLLAEKEAEAELLRSAIALVERAAEK